MAIRPKLTPIAACRVAQIDRDRLNEDIAAGYFPCAPRTTPGRARLFDPDDMVSLWLYRELQSDGFGKQAAGIIACEVGRKAREVPEADVITFVQTYFDRAGGHACTHSEALSPEEWQTHLLGGTDVRKATTFNIAKIRALIERYTEEERSVIGPEE